MTMEERLRELKQQQEAARREKARLAEELQNAIDQSRRDAEDTVRGLRQQLDQSTTEVLNRLNNSLLDGHGAWRDQVWYGNEHAKEFASSPLGRPLDLDLISFERTFHWVGSGSNAYLYAVVLKLRRDRRLLVTAGTRGGRQLAELTLGDTKSLEDALVRAAEDPELLRPS